jgi:hypothetical protein
MKAIDPTAIQSLKNAQFWLLAIATSLIAIHLTLAWKGEYSSLFGTSFLFWAAVSSLVWDKRHNLNLESGILPSFLGILLITIPLIKSASLTYTSHQSCSLWVLPY